MSYKLFIPGPIEVSDKTYAAMTQHVMGHRSGDFVKLYQSIQPKLQELFYTKDPVFISTSSAWGVMEGAIRNLVNKKVLCCMCGAFSDKWLDVAKRCGKEADGYQVEWGEHIDPEELRKRLATGEYDTVTIVHSETSTGVLNPIEEIAEVLKEFPEVCSVVDTVSSLSSVKIDKDALGIDVMLAGVQKAIALPPGMAVFSVSEKALERAATVEARGYYFDFIEFKKNHDKGMTPSTPIISLMFALESQLDVFFAEGLEARYARHVELTKMVHAWGEKHGFELLPEAKYASTALTTFKNNRELDMDAVNKILKDKYAMVINTGYGKIKGKTFRISNMGDETPETMKELLDNLDKVFEELGL